MEPERRSSAPSPPRDTTRPLAWLLPVVLLALAVVAVPLKLLSEEGLPRYRALRRELRQLRADNAALREEVVRLQERVERLRGDPSEIERLARDELGFVASDEIVLDY